MASFEEIIKKTIEMLKTNNKRYFDILFSYLYFYYQQLYQSKGTLKNLRELIFYFCIIFVFSELYEAYRTSCLH